MHLAYKLKLVNKFNLIQMFKSVHKANQSMCGNVCLFCKWVLQIFALNKLKLGVHIAFYVQIISENI